MNIQTLIVVAPYLYSDVDRIRLLQTCREFYALMPHIEFTNTYEYEHVRHVVDKLNLRNVWYKFSIMQCDINAFKNLDGFKLGAIPHGVTTLYYYSDIAVSDVFIMPETLNHIHFVNCTQVDSLPKHVRSISIPENMYVPHLSGVQVERRAVYSVKFNMDAFNHTPSGSVNWGRLVHVHLPDVFDGCVVTHKN